MDDILEISTLAAEVEVSTIAAEVEISTLAAEGEMSTVETEVRSTPLCIRQHFDPVDHGLDVDFRLTKFSKLRGSSCISSQTILRKPLIGLMEQAGKQQDGNDASKEHFKHASVDRIDMHCCVTPLIQGGKSLVQTTHFFYPLCEDPYIMGMVTCANVLGNLYAMGVTECDNILMLNTVSNNMTDNERDIVVPLMVKGFKDCAFEAGTRATVGPTMINYYLIMCGVATSVYSSLAIINPNNAVPGDVLILTKPLGTEIALTVNHWLLNQPEMWNKVKSVVNEEHVRKAYLRAVDSMKRLNKVASCLMHKYNAHGATHISEYGLLGHAQNLAKAQKKAVSFAILSIPVIANMTTISNFCGMFQILEGKSMEISGGLLICLPRVNADAFLKDFLFEEGREAWIIGMVVKGNRTANVIQRPKLLKIPPLEREGELW